MEHTANTPSKLTAWLTCVIGALFFFYQFAQMNIISAIGPKLVTKFHIDPVHLGLLGAVYFFGEILMMLPAGVILDRYSTRRVILWSLATCVASVAWMASANSFHLLLVARFITGLGGTFCFISSMRLATRWLNEKDWAKATGMIIFIGMLGGIASQTPVAILSQHLQWHQILLIDTALGCVVWLVIFCYVKDYPDNAAKSIVQQTQNINQIGFFKSFMLALKQPCSYLGGGYTCLMNLPISLFGITWGVLYLQSTHHLSLTQATEMTSLLFIGTIIGSPLIGWYSDRIQNRKKPMAVLAVLSLILILIVLYVPHLSLIALSLLFLGLGLSTSAQTLGYPVAAENVDPMLAGMSLAIASLLIMGGQAIAQPLFGYLIQIHQTHSGNNNHFGYATLMFPIALIIAWGLVFFLPKMITDKTTKSS